MITFLFWTDIFYFKSHSRHTLTWTQDMSMNSCSASCGVIVFMGRCQIQPLLESFCCCFRVSLSSQRTIHYLKKHYTECTSTEDMSHTSEPTLTADAEKTPTDLINFKQASLASHSPQQRRWNNWLLPTETGRPIHPRSDSPWCTPQPHFGRG